MICRDGMQYTGRVLAARDLVSTQSKEEPSHAQR
jgi:hypothetical protein